MVGGRRAGGGCLRKISKIPRSMIIAVLLLLLALAKGVHRFNETELFQNFGESRGEGGAWRVLVPREREYGSNVIPLLLLLLSPSTQTARACVRLFAWSF